MYRRCLIHVKKIKLNALAYPWSEVEVVLARDIGRLHVLLGVDEVSRNASW